MGPPEGGNLPLLVCLDSLDEALLTDESSKNIVEKTHAFWG